MNTVGITHVGNVRTLNEDTLMIECDKKPKFMLVADGMGGHAAGEVASKTAADSIKRYIGTLGTKKLTENQIIDAIEFANQQIIDDMEADENLKGMGTTLTFAYAEGDNLIIAQVGDSSAFLYDGDQIKKLTTDHTYVQHLIDSGVIQKNAADNYPFKNIITRALGMKKLEIDIYKIKWKADDILLLCSDGLTSCVKRERLLEVMSSPARIKDKAETFVEYALESGGKDNISVIIAKNSSAEVEA